eukprot:14876778-Ditylum_brightwellii.AAC.1
MGGGVTGCLCNSGDDMGGGVAALDNRSSRNISKKSSGLSDMSTTASNNNCHKQYDEGFMHSYYHDLELSLQIPCSGDESRSLVVQAPVQKISDLNSLTSHELMSDVTHTSLAQKDKSRQNIMNHQKKLV